MATDMADSVVVELAFGRQTGTERGVVGMASTDLVLICQRCLEPCPVRVVAEIALQLVASHEQARNLPGGFEPLVVGGDSVSLAVLIEDELLLALPPFAYHEPGRCTMPAAADALPDEGEEEGGNPFAVLQNLREDRQ